MVLLILSACSGTGKSTLAAKLLASSPQLRLSISHTTRSPRPGEIDAQHYHFVSRADFEALVARDGFAEWAEYAGNLYGTARSTIERARQDGVDLLFDIEVVGAKKLALAYPEEALRVFLLPPTWAALKGRLEGRGTETPQSLARRLATSLRELTVAPEYDALVVNQLLEEAVADVACLYRAAQLKMSARSSVLAAFVDEANADQRPAPLES